MNKHLLPVETAPKGHNRPPVLTPDELVRDFAYIDTALQELEGLVSDCPNVIEDDDDLETARTAVKRCQGVRKRLEAVRVETKEPFLSAERIVDSHFTTRKESVAKWQSNIELSAKRYLDKKAADEQARREEGARAAREAAERAAEVARKAEADRIAAEQERQLTSIAPDVDADAHDGEHFTALDDLRRDEIVARERALAANITAFSKQAETNAKPADLARTRTGDGISTLAEVWDFEVLDFNEVRTNPEVIVLIPDTEIKKAIGRHVGTHKGERPLKGVRIFPGTKVRMT